MGELVIGMVISCRDYPSIGRFDTPNSPALHIIPCCVSPGFQGSVTIHEYNG